jgi:hypothetical protein
MTGVASQAVPVPRPAPRAKIAAAVDAEEAVTPAERELLVAAQAAHGKSHRRRRIAGHRRPRNPLQVIGMVFGGWRR